MSRLIEVLEEEMRRQERTPKGYSSVEKLMEDTGLSETRIRKILRFLVKRGRVKTAEASLYRNKRLVKVLVYDITPSQLKPLPAKRRAKRPVPR